MAGTRGTFGCKHNANAGQECGPCYDIACPGRLEQVVPLFLQTSGPFVGVTSTLCYMKIGFFSIETMKLLKRLVRDTGGTEIDTLLPTRSFSG